MKRDRKARVCTSRRKKSTETRAQEIGLFAPALCVFPGRAIMIYTAKARCVYRGCAGIWRVCSGRCSDGSDNKPSAPETGNRRSFPVNRKSASLRVYSPIVTAVPYRVRVDASRYKSRFIAARECALKTHLLQQTIRSALEIFLDCQASWGPQRKKNSTDIVTNSPCLLQQGETLSRLLCHFSGFCSVSSGRQLARIYRQEEIISATSTRKFVSAIR